MFEFAQRPRVTPRQALRLAIGLSLIVITGIATAKPNNITEEEMKLIPRYCVDTQGFKYGDAYYNTSPNAGKWVGMMGKGFWALHHYCWALINLQRAARHNITAQARKGILESVVDDAMYVVKNTPPDFILLPEILTRIGDAELRLAHPDNADKAFAHARELKPDYWPAYSHWAEFLMTTGRRPEALKIVGSGLGHSPEAKVLLEQFRLLGGKPSDIPKPVEKPLPEKDAETTETPPEAAQSPALPRTTDEKEE